MYIEDIDSAVLKNELRHFLHFANSDKSAILKSSNELYKLMLNGSSVIFPNIEISLNSFYHYRFQMLQVRKRSVSKSKVVFILGNSEEISFMKPILCEFPVSCIKLI